MKNILVIALIIFNLLPVTGFAADSQLVDVDKNSNLADYFKKINKKVSDDTEDKPLLQKEVESESEVSINEEDIPLPVTAKSDKPSSSLSPLNRMMMSIFGLLLVGLVCFGGIHKMSKKKGFASIAQNITILTQKPLGPKKNLMLIRVAGETILLGVTDHNINHIKTLSLMDDELPGYTEPKFAKQLKTKIEKTQITDEIEEVDGFAVSRLDDVKRAVTERFQV